MSDPWLQKQSRAFRLLVATSWLAPEAWEAHQASAILEAIGPDLDWNEFLGWVDRHRTPVLTWCALKRVPEVVLPEAVRQGLIQRSDQARRQGMVHTQRLFTLLKAFEKAEIAALPLKGTLFSLQLYGDLTMRQSWDLDLMVPREALDRARRLLEGMGWRLSHVNCPMSPRQWEAYFRYEHDLTFEDASGVTLELHWRSHHGGKHYTSGLWEGSTRENWQGVAYQRMSPMDEVVYLCAHGAKHAWARIKWLGDLAALQAQGRIDWPSVMAFAGTLGQRPALLQTASLLERIYGLPKHALAKAGTHELNSRLMDFPLQELSDANTYKERGSMGTLCHRVRRERYESVLLPRGPLKHLIGKLLYSRSDFETVSLPQGLFWAYIPLRPILFLVRRAGWRQRR